MDHWEEVLPIYFRVQHEELLKIKPLQSLIEFCELDFELSTLEFYKTKRAVKNGKLRAGKQPLNKV